MIKFLINYVFYQIFKYGPRSSAHTLTKGKIRSFFGKNMMYKAGKNVDIERGATFSRRTEIGNNSGIGVNCRLQGKVIIGNNVMMGQDCLIYTSNHSFIKTDVPIQKQGYQSERKVVIGDDVWIGARVIILPGVTIGKGVVIGAGAVATSDIPDFVIAAGNPARIIKERK